MSTDLGTLLDLGWKLLLVLGLAFLAFVLLRWLTGSTIASNGLLQVRARLPIGPQQSVVLVAVGRKLLLIGQTSHQISLLGELSPDDLAGEPLAPTVGGGQPPHRSPLLDWLGELIDRRRGGARRDPLERPDWRRAVRIATPAASAAGTRRNGWPILAGDRPRDFAGRLQHALRAAGVTSPAGPLGGPLGRGHDASRPPFGPGDRR